MKIQMKSGEIMSVVSMEQRGLRNENSGEITRKIEVALNNKKSVLLDPDQFTIIPNSYEFDKACRR